MLIKDSNGYISIENLPLDIINKKPYDNLRGNKTSLSLGICEFSYICSNKIDFVKRRGNHWEGICLFHKELQDSIIRKRKS